MIPEQLDDGFTTEVAEGVFCRPMLWRARQGWKRVASDDAEAGWALLRTSNVTYVDTDVLNDHRVAVIQTVCGYSSQQEAKDFQDLHDSIYLHYVNPGLSTLSCAACKLWCVNHDTGEIVIGANGMPTPLPKKVTLPCDSRGCLKSHWRSPLGLSNDRWAKTWTHYWMFRDSPKMMTDPIFRRNAALIRWIVDYGRDRRFDPFVGGSSSGRSTDVPAERVPRPAGDGACCPAGGCAARACGTECGSV